MNETSVAAEKRKWTQQELCEEARRRFGDDVKTWAFKCPHCGDVANAQDFIDAKADPGRLGQECIGRQLGALKGGPTNDSGKSRAERGCDWAAYGLFSGPWRVVMPDGKETPSFPLAPAPAPLKDYRVTFGVMYAEETHPFWPQAHPDGWLTIEAGSEDEAREQAVRLLGACWAYIYDPGEISVNWGRMFPAGELARFRVGTGWIGGAS